MALRSARASTTARGGEFECGVAAHGIVSATLDDVRTLRDQPGGPAGPAIPPRFLRQADEQTVVGLASVLRAMAEPALQDRCFDEWGIVAGPRFSGRVMAVAAFDKFAREGLATFSPHIIPQYSLHAMAGAISVALGLHGPNFGVSGGADGLAEGLTAAVSLMDGDVFPGLWLVLTGWDPEPLPRAPDSGLTNSVCHALALALVPQAAEHGSLRLTAAATPRLSDDPAATSTLESLIDRLATSASGQPMAPWSLPLGWGGQIEQLANSASRARKAA